MRNNVILKSKEFSQALLVLVLLVTCGYSQGETKNNLGTADKNLKSTARVNPSTFAMEFSMPLASYPGRAGNSVPVVINYSSKLWQLETSRNWSERVGYIRRYYTDVKPKFAERSSAGWTSSLMPPRIEIKEDYYDESGNPWSFRTSSALITDFNEDNPPTENILPVGCFYTGDTRQYIITFGDQTVRYVHRDYFCIDGNSGSTISTGPVEDGSGESGGEGTFVKYVKRVRVHMPDGSSNEFRKDDGVYDYCYVAENQRYCNGAATPQDLTGEFVSTDGSKMRLVIGNAAQSESSYLYLPNGSKYTFPVNRKRGADWYAAEYKDVNGNITLYEQTVTSTGKLVGGIRDTLERPGVTDPLAQNKQVVLTAGQQFYQAPGMGGNTTQDYALNWEELRNVFEDPNNQQLNYLGQHVCFIGGQNTMKTHTDGPQQDDPNTPDDDDGPVLFDSSGRTRVCSVNGNGPDRRFNPIVLADITQPDGTKYSFKYNSYGEITEIKYPTGGYERFRYGKIVPMGDESSIIYDQANRGVQEHWVYNDDGNLESHRTFHQSLNDAQYPILPSSPYVVTTTHRDGSKSIRYLHRSSDVQFGFTDPRSGMPYDERTLDTNGQIRRRKLTEWTYAGPLPGGDGSATRDTRVSREISIIIEGSQAIATLSQTDYENPSINQNAPSDPKYFAHLNPVRSRAFHYQVINAEIAKNGSFDEIMGAFANAPAASVSETDYLYGAEGNAYFERGIIGLPQQTRVLDPLTNETISKNEFKYDEQNQYYSIDTAGTTVAYAEPTGAHAYLRGNVTTVRSWVKENNSWLESHTQYDKFGNVRKVWDARNDQHHFVETIYSPDYKYAFPTKVITPAPDPENSGHGTTEKSEVTTTYDLTTGLPLTITNLGDLATLQDDLTTATEYDEMLHPVRIYPLNYAAPETRTEHGVPNANGQYPSNQRFVKVRKQIDAANWEEETNWFDGLGRTVKTQKNDSQGNVYVETQYDDMGRIKKVSNPYRNVNTRVWTETTYDNLGRIKFTATLNDNAKIETVYGLATSGTEIGTITTIKDQSGKLKRNINNVLNQLIRVDEPNNANQLGTIDAPNLPTKYEYNGLGSLRKVIQGEQTRTFVYDSLNRLRWAINPESGTTTYQYDNNSNLTAKTDARGVSTHYTYDRLNRVIRRSYSGENGYQTPQVDYFYDGVGVSSTSPFAKGKLTKISSAVSTTEYTGFDALGRVLSHKQTIDGQNYTTANVYNLRGDLLEETYPSTRVVKNTFDADGDLSKVESKKDASDYFRNYATSFFYTPSGEISSVRLGNGKFETTQYNNRLQPVQFGLGSSIGNPNLLKLDYDYGSSDNNGNVKSQTITVPTLGQNEGFTAVQTYTYDSLNRLQSATENIIGQSIPIWKQTFQYDRYGNRNFDAENTTTLGSCPASICNPSVNQLNNRLIGYVYDSAGNTKTDAESRTFIYDGENKQVEVKDANGATIGRYFYDGDGKRVKKITAMETTVFVYNASGRLVAEYSTQLSPQPQISYLTNDHLGSPRITTNENGKTISRRDFQPFGEEIVASKRTHGLGYTQDSVRQKFTSYERDIESELDFAQARYYKSQQGRFTTIDPAFESMKVAVPQSWNRYTYVLNNPLLYIDPNGELWVRNTGDNRNETGKAYVWVDKCGEGQTCYVAIASAESNDKALIIYGSKGVNDRDFLLANENGMIDLRSLSQHHDAQFIVADGQNRPEEFASTFTSAVLFNVASQYHQNHMGDNKLVMTASVEATGKSAVGCKGPRIPCHSKRHNGNSLDIRYMNKNGKDVRSVNEADVGRTNELIALFAANGLTESFTGNQSKFGLPAKLASEEVHKNHLHVGVPLSKPSINRRKV